VASEIITLGVGVEPLPFYSHARQTDQELSDAA